MRHEMTIANLNDKCRAVEEAIERAKENALKIDASKKYGNVKADFYNFSKRPFSSKTSILSTSSSEITTTQPMAFSKPFRRPVSDSRKVTPSEAPSGGNHASAHVGPQDRGSEYQQGRRKTKSAGED